MLKRMLLSSVAHQVLSRVSCDILAVPAVATQREEQPFATPRSPDALTRTNASASAPLVNISTSSGGTAALRRRRARVCSSAGFQRWSIDYDDAFSEPQAHALGHSRAARARGVSAENPVRVRLVVEVGTCHRAGAAALRSIGWPRPALARDLQQRASASCRSQGGPSAGCAAMARAPVRTLERQAGALRPYRAYARNHCAGGAELGSRSRRARTASRTSGQRAHVVHGGTNRASRAPARARDQYRGEARLQCGYFRRRQGH